LFFKTIERWRNEQKWGFGVAIAAFLVCFGVRYSLDVWLPPGLPFITFFPAIILATFFAGVWPGVVVAVLSVLSAWYFFLAPGNSFALDRSEALALVVFISVVAPIIFVIHVLNLALERLQIEGERAVTLSDQRGTMFMELQHRISNNLQLVGALLHLERANVTDERAKQALANASLRLTLIGKLHRKLHDPSGGSIDFGEFLTGLCADILESSGVRNIECLVTSAILVLPPEKSMPIALIATELVSNAIEHGFAGRSEGTINVGLQPDVGVIVLTVVDDGNGLASGFDGAVTKSLGLGIVQILTQQLRGKFEMVNGKGTTCRLAVPHP